MLEPVSKLQPRSGLSSFMVSSWVIGILSSNPYRLESQVRPLEIDVGTHSLCAWNRSGTPGWKTSKSEPASGVASAAGTAPAAAAPGTSPPEAEASVMYVWGSLVVKRSFGAEGSG